MTDQQQTVATKTSNCCKGGAAVSEQSSCCKSDDASCCAAFYAKPATQYFLGESFHPGGEKFTLEVAKRLQLIEGERVLDVACGGGVSLRSIVDAYPVTAVGIDVAPPEDTQGRLRFQTGDAHSIAFPNESFDVLLCECALSTFVDQPKALSEMHRVLKPGGRLAITDMLANGPIPENLREWVHVGTCLERAMSLPEYVALVKDAHFEVVDSWDATWTLRDLISQIKRKLVGVAFARSSGALPMDINVDVPRARDALKSATLAMDDGIVGYGALLATKAQ